MLNQALGNSPRATWILTDLSVDSFSASVTWKRAFVGELSTQALATYRDWDALLLHLAPV
jgi:hypothetical protein